MKILILYILPLLISLWLVYLLAFKTYDDKEHKEKVKAPLLAYVLFIILSFVPGINIFLACLIFLYIAKILDKQIYSTSVAFKVV